MILDVDNINVVWCSDDVACVADGTQLASGSVTGSDGLVRIGVRQSGEMSFEAGGLPVSQNKPIHQAYLEMVIIF